MIQAVKSNLVKQVNANLFMYLTKNIMIFMKILTLKWDHSLEKKGIYLKSKKLNSNYQLRNQCALSCSAPAAHQVNVGFMSRLCGRKIIYSWIRTNIGWTASPCNHNKYGC